MRSSSDWNTVVGEEFISRAMKIACHGVAMLSRTVFIESVGRYERIFRPNPPSRFAQFTERAPMVKGRVDKKASTATGYAWLVWEKERLGKGVRACLDIRDSVTR
jgi:hypothetical protein